MKKNIIIFLGIIIFTVLPLILSFFATFIGEILLKCVGITDQNAMSCFARAGAMGDLLYSMHQSWLWFIATHILGLFFLIVFFVYLFFWELIPWLRFRFKLHFKITKLRLKLIKQCLKLRSP